MCIPFYRVAKAQVCENSKLALLLKQSKKDSVQKIERLAALKFHKLINDYRVKSGSEALVWDDTLWLTCRNHDLWMNAKSELSHDEKAGTVNFTGKSPGERYAYTSNNKGLCSWTGENALYNWSKNGNSIDEIAKDIATTSFEQWKHSPGHNENMLAKRSKVHGVAFYLGNGGKVWGTDLFAYTSTNKIYWPENKIKNSPQILTDATELKTTPVKAPVKKYIRLDLKETKEHLVNALYTSADVKRDLAISKSKIMERAAEHHTEYMANVKMLTHEEKRNNRNFYGETEKKRMMKASKGFYFFTKFKTKAHESIAMVETDIAALNIDSIAGEINKQLNLNTEGPITSVGYGVSLKRLKNQLKIYVTRVEGVRRQNPKQMKEA